MKFREANVNEAARLNELIRCSKAYWGYSDDFMDQFMQQWGIDEDYIENHHVVVLESRNDLVGLFGFKADQEEPKLDLFFIAPEQIGQGIGKRLWEKVVDYARTQSWRSFKLIADPNAEMFYQYIGVVTIGQFESFPGRFVPVMRYGNF